MPYILLALVAVVVLAFTARRRSFLTILLPAIAAIGSSMALVDVLTSNVLRLYSFHPHLLADPGADLTLGFSYPTACSSRSPLPACWCVSTAMPLSAS